MRQATRGRSDAAHNSAAKHVLAELKLAHRRDLQHKLQLQRQQSQATASIVPTGPGVPQEPHNSNGQRQLVPSDGLPLDAACLGPI
jgi:hypothetical protein